MTPIDPSSQEEGDFVIDGPGGAIAGAVIAVVTVYALRVLFSVSRELIAPYAKPRRTFHSPKRIR